MSNQLTRVGSPNRVAGTGYGRPWSSGYGRPASPGYGRPWSPRRGYYAPPIYAPAIYAPPIVTPGYGYGYPYGGYGGYGGYGYGYGGYPYGYVSPAALPVLAATNAVAGLANLAAAATYY